MPQIHPTAIIDSKAEIAEDVSIGPFTIIGADVSIASGCRIGSFCVLQGFTELGPDNEIYTGAVIGSPPQDVGFKGKKSFIKIGSGNKIREYITINPGTEERTTTFIGNNNMIMAYSHIAHDCNVGSNCILANAATLAGYVDIEDYAVIGGLVAVHQFVRVGKYSIVGGCSKVVQDIPPFSTCDGHPAKIYGLNLVGLRRANFTKQQIRILHSIFNILFFSNLNHKNALTQIQDEFGDFQLTQDFVDFFKTSKRGMSKCR